MSLIDRLFGIKIVKSRNYTSLQETVIHLEDDKTRFELEKTIAEKEAERIKKELIQSERSKQVALEEMQEAMALAESYLRDQKSAETKCQEARRLLNEAVRDGNSFSRIERLVLLEHFIPPICDTPYTDKIKWGSSHLFPSGTNQFVEKIAKCRYVKQVRRGRMTRFAKNTHLRNVVGLFNGYHFQAVYVRGDGVEVDITSTAKTDLQIDFVYKVLLKELNLNSHY